MKRYQVGVAASVALFFAISLGTTRDASAQRNDAGENAMQGLRFPHVSGSRNIRIASHLQVGGFMTTADIQIEQERARPYVYLPRRDFVPWPQQPDGLPSKGVDIVSIKDLSHPRVIYSWRIEQQELHRPPGGLQNKYFKLKGRYYDVQSFQFQRGGPDVDLGAVVLDVTGLPDPGTVKEVGRIRVPDVPGGFHNVFAYKHSDGRVLLLATTNGTVANVYDMEKFLAGDPKSGLIATIENPDTSGFFRGYHDFYVGYDPVTHQDRFYGAGYSGYYVFDVSDVTHAKLLTSITGAAGTFLAHTITPEPTGRYVVTEMEYQYTPLRIFDLKPGLDGQVKTISRPIGAWEAHWDGDPHNHVVRWPYVFVSGYMDGLQVFNMMDPTNPYTVGHFYTCECTLAAGAEGAGQVGGMAGAFGVDVRNADGLVVISDKRTGFWAFYMDGFDGWNGHQWGLPNISSAQDWDSGPEGAPKRTNVSAR